MKRFNVTGICIPQRNYMVDMSGRIETVVSDYIREGKYFSINRARQYGKTTMLYRLEERLKMEAPGYLVLSLSFEAADEYFQSTSAFAEGFVLDVADCLRGQGIPEEVAEAWSRPLPERFPLRGLGRKITELCRSCGKRVVLIIDEVDKSPDSQVFLSFLGLLRTKYLEEMKGKDRTFCSVVLAGVYDVKNLQLKLHPDREPKYNSPWNIAADFRVDMSFRESDIASMLTEYEEEHRTGMEVSAISRLIYEYTSGYPYLVSRICQLADERIAGTDGFPDQKSVWTREGISAAELLLRKESNTLFDDMVKKLADYPELKRMLQDILFRGCDFPFDPDSHLVGLGTALGFLKEKNGAVAVGNRIFETKLYDLFLAEGASQSASYQQGSLERNRYVADGILRMELVMKDFCRHFTEICGGSDSRFVEEQGRKLFLLYLKPIINGTGNYYIESRTRDFKRTDIIVDYRGEQHIIELKIWHGEEYNRRGEEQLFQYLEYYGKDVGYLLSFNFNQKKQVGVREILLGGKRIVEATV